MSDAPRDPIDLRRFARRRGAAHFPGPPRPPAEAERARIVQEARANIAFEDMIVAALYAAAVSGAAHFAIRLGARLVDGGGLLVGALDAAVAAAAYAFIVFLGGVFGAVCLGAPLWRRLDRAGVRRVWPFYALALAGAAIFVLLSGAHSFIGALKAFGPAALIAWFFVRRAPNQPAAPQSATDAGGAIVRLN